MRCAPPARAPEFVLVIVGAVVGLAALALAAAPAAAGRDAGATPRCVTSRALLVLGGLCALAFFVERMSD